MVIVTIFREQLFWCSFRVSKKVSTNDQFKGFTMTGVGSSMKTDCTKRKAYQKLDECKINPFTCTLKHNHNSQCYHHDDQSIYVKHGHSCQSSLRCWNFWHYKSVPRQKRFLFPFNAKILKEFFQEWVTLHTPEWNW